METVIIYLRDIISYLEDNAGWLLGSGGVAGVVLALLRFRRSKSPPSGMTISGGPANGDVVVGKKTTITKTGIGPIEFGLGAAILVAAVGGVFLLMGPETKTISADNGSVAVQGSSNRITVGGQ